MTSMKEAMRDAGLTRDTFEQPPTTVLTRQVDSAALDAPASHMAMQHMHLPGAYLGRRWNMDRFRTESISLGPASPREPQPDNSLARIREIAANTQPRVAAEMLAKVADKHPAALAAALAKVTQPNTCDRCHMRFPAGFRACPDC